VRIIKSGHRGCCEHAHLLPTKQKRSGVLRMGLTRTTHRSVVSLSMCPSCSGCFNHYTWTISFLKLVRCSPGYFTSELSKRPISGGCCNVSFNHLCKVLSGCGVIGIRQNIFSVILGRCTSFMYFMRGFLSTLTMLSCSENMQLHLLILCTTTKSAM